MPSDKFEAIFNDAASIVERRCQGMHGVSIVLDDIRRRVRTPIMDPLKNRALIVEPWIDAQQLNVPLQTAQCVADELHNLNILHLWARARCPVADTDNNVIAETDDSVAFKGMLRELCPHCGQYHNDLSEEQVETFYAIHFDDKQDDFELRQFLFRRRGKQRDLRSSDSASNARSTAARFNWRFWRSFRSSTACTGSDVVADVEHALALNQRTIRLPDANSVCMQILRLMMICAFAAVVVVALCYVLVDPFLAFIVAAFYVICQGTASYVSLRAVSPIPDRVGLLVFCGYCLSGVFFAIAPVDLAAGVGSDAHFFFARGSDSRT